jgi:hypothetical protein
MLMRHLSPTRRVFLAALAIVQVAVPALVAIADAELALRSGGPAVVHVEDHTGRACRAVHPDDCALCQFLSLLAPQRSGSTVLPAVDVARPGICDDASRLPSSIVRALHRTRAPPVG